MVLKTILIYPHPFLFLFKRSKIFNIYTQVVLKKWWYQSNIGDNHLKKKIKLTSSSRSHIEFSQILSCKSKSHARLVHHQAPFQMGSTNEAPVESSMKLICSTSCRLHGASMYFTQAPTLLRFLFQELERENLSAVTVWWPWNVIDEW